MLLPKGPWFVKSLKQHPHSPWQSGRRGAYIIAVLRNKYRKEHGSSRFIYIGGMGNSDNASLGKRIGEFLMAAFGFPVYHSGGARAFGELAFIPQLASIDSPSQKDVKDTKARSLSPWDLEIWWYEADDPLCCEAFLMKSYYAKFKQLPKLNKNWQYGCREHKSPVSKNPYEADTFVPWDL